MSNGFKEDGGGELRTRGMTGLFFLVGFWCVLHASFSTCSGVRLLLVI